MDGSAKEFMLISPHPFESLIKRFVAGFGTA
jgi:hypothetical protein